MEGMVEAPEHRPVGHILGGGMLGMFLPGILYVCRSRRDDPSELGHRGRRGQRFGDRWAFTDRPGPRLLDPVLHRHEQLGSGRSAMHRHALVCLGPDPQFGQERTSAKSTMAFVAVLIWGTIYVNITLPLIILAISANIANFTMALSAILTVIVNRKFLAEGISAEGLREVIMIASMAFFGLFFTLFILTQFLGIKVN